MELNCTYSSFLLAIVCLQLFVRSGLGYTAAVVEYAPLRSFTDPQDILFYNAHKYAEIIKEAGLHYVDIIVFPECGLTTIKLPVVREEIFPYLVEVPDVGSNPCELPSSHKVLQILSCAVSRSQKYVVINLSELAHCSVGDTDCPADGSLFYNTNIAFNRSGHIVSRYRKTNLFIEPEFNSTKVPDYSWFDTDFGVRFGLFTCFDILFSEPTNTLLNEQNITNFVYPTAWFSELPFLTAVSVQAGWAYANDVNLLAAGYNYPNNTNTGSGIYLGRDGEAVACMSEDPTTKLLISYVDSRHRGRSLPRTEKITFPAEPDFHRDESMNFFHYNLENFTSLIVSGPDCNLEYRNEGFSCKISAQLEIIGDGPTYRMVAWSGVRTYGELRTVHIEVCGIIACTDSQLSSCGYKPVFTSPHVQFSQISIQTSSNKSLLSYPITLTSNLLSFPAKQFYFTSKKRLHEYDTDLASHHLERNFFTFAIFRNG